MHATELSCKPGAGSKSLLLEPCRVISCQAQLRDSYRQCLPQSTYPLNAIFVSGQCTETSQLPEVLVLPPHLPELNNQEHAKSEGSAADNNFCIQILTVACSLVTPICAEPLFGVRGSQRVDFALDPRYAHTQVIAAHDA